MRCLAFLLLGLALAWAQGQTGLLLYARHCQSCHRFAGSAVAPGLLREVGRLASLKEGRVYLVSVLLYGVTGWLERDGGRYYGSMPGFGGRLKDGEIAEVLNFLLGPKGGPKPFTPEEVKALRGRPLRPEEVLTLRPSP